MKIFRQDTDVTNELTEKINSYKQILKNEKLLVLRSFDHVDHVSAYLAWQDIPGKILLLAPILPEMIQDTLIKQVKSLDDVEDGVFFHTSGTTGIPKLIQHGRTQFATFDQMSQNTYEFTKESKFLSVVPPFTIAFWCIVIPSFCSVKFSIQASTRDSLINDLMNAKCDTIMNSPNIVDFLRTSNAPIKFDSFKYIGVGGGSIADRHMKYFFDNGASTCFTSYGSTESGGPILSRKIKKDDQFLSYLDMIPMASSVELKFTDNGELLIKSPSNCVNYKSFNHIDDWRCTGDLWEQKENGLIKFVGRNDDIVKLNGYPANLLAIETWVEDNSSIGECMAKVRSFSGTDYLELFCTKQVSEDEQKIIRERMSEVFTECQIPKKFKVIEQLPRNPLGKKQRHLV